MKSNNESLDRIKDILNGMPVKANPDDFFPYVDRTIKNREILLLSAKKYGTPQYILDEKLLIERINLFRNAFKKRLSNIKIFYAFKCNDLPWMLGILKNNGIHADVAGFFELSLALKLGFKEIIFTSPVKSSSALELAVKNSGNVIINIDKIDELKKIVRFVEESRVSRPVNVSFRLNPGSEISGQWSKFGLSMAELRGAVEIVFKSRHINWAGIHFHSSWNETPERHVNNIEIIGKFLKENFSPVQLKGLRFFDIGGGFLCEGNAPLFSGTEQFSAMELLGNKCNAILPHEPVKWKPESIEKFAEEISLSIKKNIKSIPALSGIEVWLEPGRFIASMPTSILLQVVSVKEDRIYVNGGINLIGSNDFEYDFFPIVNLCAPKKKLNKAKIYGCLCDPNDLWGYSYYGEKCKPKDILAVLHQGAYTFSTAWRFIEPNAPYASFSKKKLILAKKKEEFEDKYKGCLF